MTDLRLDNLKHWLSGILDTFEISPLEQDASFRRYFRVYTAGSTFIVMDAPPETEDCLPFVNIAFLLKTHKVTVPEVIATNLAEGFLLLSDFGNQHLLTTLKSLDEGDAECLYRTAITTLIEIQLINPKTLPIFSEQLIFQELQLWQEWFLEGYLGLTCDESTQTMLQQLFTNLTQQAISQPQVFMHRDYHSANLMDLPNGHIGVLDFQDAFLGPLTYDLVSLLRDCYIDWSDELIDDLLYFYYKHNGISKIMPETSFKRAFDWMGMQRHLKALLTFARKKLRDHNSNYLQHMPRTLNYLVQVSKLYSELKPFHLYLTQTIMPAFNKVTASCAP